MAIIKIIGIGSPFNMDKIGWDIGSTLQQRHFSERFSQHDVTIISNATPSSIALLADGTDLLILIDALTGHTTQGEIHKLTLDSIDENEKSLSSHGLGIKQMLSIVPDPPAHISIFGIIINEHINFENTAMIADEITDRLIPELEKEIAHLC